MELFEGIIQVTLVISLVLFIIFNALKNKGKRVQSLVLMCVSIFFTLFFVFALLFDNIIQSGNVTQYFDNRLYYVLIVISVVYFILFLIMFIHNRGFIAAKVIKKKMVYTYHDKEEYIYVFYIYGNYIYLLKDNYAGIRYKLKKMEFSDDAIRTICKSFNLKLDFDPERSGMITIKGEKVDQIYYCYKIDLDYELNSDMFVKVDALKLTELPMQDFDRFVIYNCLMKYDFDEEF